MRKAKLENERALQKEHRRETQGRKWFRLKRFGFAFVFTVVDSCATRFLKHQNTFKPRKGLIRVHPCLLNFRCKQVKTPPVLQEEPEKKHKSKCLLLHLSSLQQHDAGPGMGQVDAVAALEKCQICCCVLLHLRLTAYSVAMLLPFAFYLAAQLHLLTDYKLSSWSCEHYKLFTFTTNNKIKATLTRKLL